VDHHYRGQFLCLTLLRPGRVSGSCSRGRHHGWIFRRPDGLWQSSPGPDQAIHHRVSGFPKESANPRTAM